MRLKIYNLFVNRVPGIKARYHRMHDNAIGMKTFLSWLYLIWLNFAYYVLFCRFLGKVPAMDFFEEKNLHVDKPESSFSPDVKEYIEKLTAYDVISFDIFDTLIFRPFAEPADLFYFVGERLGYMNFRRIRMETESEARWVKYKNEESFEVTLEEIWNLIEEKTGLSAEEGMRIEQECELAFCYANPFMQDVYECMRQQGKRIVIISDMYLSEAFLQRMLEQNGYSGYESLYVSCEYDKNKGAGELFELAKRELGLEKGSVVHIGDNEHSDVKRAKKAGFDTMYYPNVNKKCLLYRPYDMSPIVGGAYRGLVNTHLNCGVFKHSMEYEYGYIYGGLFVVGYCAFIHEYCQKNQIDKLLFLSRDGDILSRVYQLMYPNEQTEYVLWSRKAATKLMASSDRYDFFRRFLLHKVNQNISLEKVFESMELSDMLSLLPKEIKSQDELTSENVKQIKTFLLDNWEKVEAAYVDEHLAAKTYYKEKLAGASRAVAVDIGWAGSGAIALNHLVSRVWKLDCEIIGIVAGTNTVHNIEADASETFLQTGQLVSYMYSLAHNRDLAKKHDLNKDYNVFWELLLSSSQPQFVGFGWKEESVQLRFGKRDANQEGILDVQAGILDFSKEYLEHFGTYDFMFRISGRDAYAPMLIAASRNERYLQKMKERFDLVIGVE